MNQPTTSGLPLGSWVYRNWKSHAEGRPEEYAEEVPLYSDARFTGEVRSGLGPYLLLNTVPDPHEAGTLVPALVLRLGVHLQDDTDQIVEAFRAGVPDLTAFVGGTVHDELASLVALSHRVRVAIGSPTRWFHKHDTDQRGSPRHSGGQPPVLAQGRVRQTIPELRRHVPLSLEPLATYPTIPWDSARELARAARSYRQAVWVADGDANLGWLLLVSAAETAANEWARLAREPTLVPAALLSEMRPDFAERLRRAADGQEEAVVNEVGATLVDVLRAQWKFREFLLRYGLQAPQPRPKAWPIAWTRSAMKKILETVYRYRSESLHSSKPFPLPMCEPPFPSEDDQGARAWSERPGGASYQSGGLWTEEQLPINLHAFHHMVASAIGSWWQELASLRT